MLGLAETQHMLYAVVHLRSTLQGKGGFLITHTEKKSSGISGLDNTQGLSQK